MRICSYKRRNYKINKLKETNIFGYLLIECSEKEKWEKMGGKIRKR
jgi:hypothetical protein